MIPILIIEDDLDFAYSLKESLEQEPDLKVIDVVSNEEQAIALMKSGALANVGCVLLDLQLPANLKDKEASTTVGLHLLARMRTEYRFYGTIIVLTSSRDINDGKQALNAGCDGYLCKYTPLPEVPNMLSELKTALRRDVVIVSREMRHIFFREDISAKEARLMDLLCLGHDWSEIAKQLSYKSAKAAANNGDRVFEKLLTDEERKLLDETGQKKRSKAIEIWRARRFLETPQSTVENRSTYA